MNLFASCWILLAGSLVIALPVMILKIKDTVPVEEDLKFTDETIDDVIGHKVDHGFNEPQNALHVVDNTRKDQLGEKKQPLV